MICVTIARGRHRQMIAEYLHVAEHGAELVEMRLDYIRRAVNLNRLLAQRPCPVIATCRRRQDGGRWERSEADRQVLLRTAIVSGVDYVDLEGDIAGEIRRYGRTKRIVSYHNFEETPYQLEKIWDDLAAKDADIVKLATLANSIEDVLRMKAIVERSRLPTIGLCMGELGVFSRLLSVRWGSPFTFASFGDRSVAPGQIPWQQMKDLYRVGQITPRTQLFGVIADPVAHSYSPIVHNAAFEQQQLDSRYLPFRVPAEELEMFLQACPELGIRGLSVTIPHKEAVLPFLTQAEAAVNGIGAANTIVFDGDERVGFNTDYRAAMDCLTDTLTNTDGKGDFRGRTVKILGAGGAARAIGWGLKQRGADVIFTNRSMDRAGELAMELGCRVLPWEERHEIACGVLVNCTPCGMHPDLDSTPYDGNRLDSRMIVFDTVYNPEQTLLVKHARQAGCTVISGVDMFVRQAAYQYKLFTGREAPLSMMRETLKRATSPVSYAAAEV